MAALVLSSPVGDPDRGLVAHHACERLYADAGVRSERIAAHKSAFLAEERRRLRANSASAKKHSRTPVKSPSSSSLRHARHVARNLHLERFSDAFYEYDDFPPPPPPWPEPAAGAAAPEGDARRGAAITNRADFDAWAAHVRRRFARLTSGPSAARPRSSRRPQPNVGDLRVLEENWL